jgi:hypothetical protein
MTTERTDPADHPTRRTWTALLLSAVALVLLVSCSTRRTATTDVAGLPPSSTTATAAGRPGPDPHELQAEATARTLLARVPPGPGWRPVLSPPAPILDAAGERPGTPDLVDLSRLWTVAEPWTSVRTYLEGHPPDGMQQAGIGSSADRGVTTSWGIGFAPPPLPPTTDHWQVVEYTIAPLPAGGTGVRVDVQVIWLPTRPQGTFVSPGATSVTVTATWGSDATAQHLTRTVTDPTTIAELARTVNGLSVADPGSHGCTMDVGLRLEVHFSGPAPADDVTGTSDPACGDTDLQAVRSVALSTGPTLLDQETRVLGTTLASLQDRAIASSMVPPPTTTSH